MMIFLFYVLIGLAAGEYIKSDIMAKLLEYPMPFEMSEKDFEKVYFLFSAALMPIVAYTAFTKIILKINQ